MDAEGAEERGEIDGSLPLRPGREETALSEPEDGAGRKRAVRRRYQEKADAEVQKKPDSVNEPDNMEDGSPQELPRDVSEHSSRMGSIRGHPSGSIAYVEAAAEVSHIRKKKQVQAYARKEKEKQAEVKSREADAQKESRRFTGNKEAAEQSMENFREEIKGKTKREQLHKEQRKKSSRLSFGDEGGMVRGAGVGVTKKAVSAAAGSAAVYLHGKGHEAEQENAAVEGSHRAELVAENALRYAMHKTNRGIPKRGSRLKMTSAEAAERSRIQFEAAPETETPVVVEEPGSETEATPFAVPGNGQLVDDKTDDETKQFLTIQTKNGNTFFLVLDRSSNTENVYMLSMIDENDLTEFLETEPAQEEPETEEPQVVIPEPETTPAETEAEPESEKQPEGMNTGILLAAALLLAGGLAFYYLKVVKPKIIRRKRKGSLRLTS